ncbi:MAG: hypothetical protein APG08_01198 [Candidatus Methanofastidiosum methylothiophilum]|jgi:hypothetical protein|uniref:Uncharacterized protein n=1 Tax=Candidatus Methanofastidiosum methylothiophilum TaxID=1705564 RepID=A0A150JIN2_9EURY|nr:MAG: hypothetical protein AN188_00839 [Candidatus Methanofastidiosum methylthiophilus]HNV93654.1 hypothetical protein [Methanofastidiosum sp.]KYC56109.1 MAG: hypothetical protein APG08_01198 [Candidatus Methanofastidiosum methylthiophilus]KYC57031.1 MAG: hypothetical protein APG09_01179 [Candidatus Methanofastidiosum methylthiophilus]HNZ60266.1 hypothetical protein [Methanofastidiosum sp.]
METSLNDIKLVDKEKITFPVWTFVSMNLLDTLSSLLTKLSIVSCNIFLLDCKMTKNFAFEIFALAYLSMSSMVEFFLRENSCLGNAVGEFYAR